MRIDLARWFLVVICLSLFAATGYSEREETASEKALKGLSWRSIGPADMSGRVVDIAGVPGDPSTILAASASGGLWKLF
jgi:hypothetical protein